MAKSADREQALNLPPVEQTPAPQQTGDPFSLENLRLSQDFDQAVGVQKLLTIVPVRKPNRQEFIRVRPGPEWQLDTALLDFKEDGETYLVAPALWPYLSDDVSFRRLVVAINRQRTLFIWPLRLPRADGRLDAWSSSALQAAERAETAWVKLQGNRDLGAYEVYQGSDDLPAPEWPDYSFQEILNVAFRDFRITDLEHPAIKRLHGKL